LHFTCKARARLRADVLAAIEPPEDQVLINKVCVLYALHFPTPPNPYFRPKLGKPAKQFSKTLAPTTFGLSAIRSYTQ
jgi:hypothetical protein